MRSNSTYYQSYPRPSPYFPAGSTQTTAKTLTSPTFRPRIQATGTFDPNLALQGRKSSVPVLSASKPSNKTINTSQTGQDHVRSDAVSSIQGERRLKKGSFQAGKAKNEWDYSANFANYNQICGTKDGEEASQGLYMRQEGGFHDNIGETARRKSSKQGVLRHKSSEKKTETPKCQQLPEFSGAFLYENLSSSSHTMPTVSNKAGEQASISYKLYLERLLQAHSIVDELLKSRGLQTEDERNFLKYIQFSNAAKEMNDDSRRSSGSDSGLSLGNDLDQYANQPEEITYEDTFQKNQESFDRFIIIEKLNTALVQLSVPNKRMKKGRKRIVKIAIKGLSNDVSKQKEEQQLYQLEDSDCDCMFWKDPEAIGDIFMIKQLVAARACLKILIKERRKMNKKRILKLIVNKPLEETEKLKKSSDFFSGIPTQCSIVECFYRPMRFHAQVSAIKALSNSYKVQKKITLKNAFIQKNIHIRNKKIHALCSTIILKIILKGTRVTAKFKSRAVLAKSTLKMSIQPEAKKMITNNHLETFVGKPMRKILPAHARKKDSDKSTLFSNEIQMPPRRVIIQNNTHSEKRDEEFNNIRKSLKKVDFNKTVSNKGLSIYQTSSPTVKDDEKKSEDNVSKVIQSAESRFNVFNKNAANLQKSTKSAVNKSPCTHPVGSNSSSGEKIIRRKIEVIGSKKIQEKQKINCNEAQPGAKTKPMTNQNTLDRIEKPIVNTEKQENFNLNKFKIPKPVFMIRRSPTPLQKKEKPINEVVKVSFLQAKPEIKKVVQPKIAPEPKTDLILRDPSFPSKISNTGKLKLTSSPSTMPSNKPRITSDRFGITLKSVNKREIRKRAAIIQQLPKKPWIPRWRRTERLEEEQKIEEQQRTEQFSMADTRFEKLVENGQTYSEAEKVVIAARKRQELEDEAKLLDYQERRRLERMNEDEELRMLRAKQEKRRLERKEEEEREIAEKRREEKRIRNLQDENARKKSEVKSKAIGKEKKPNIVPSMNENNQLISTKSAGKTDRTDKFGNIVQAKQEMSLTKEQQEQVKHSYLNSVKNSIDLSATSTEELKVKIKQLHQRICRLESEKYDLEKRHERQEYDLKELNERQRQVARNKFSRMNVDMTKSALKHPKAAFPCFPNVPPPRQVYSFRNTNDSSKNYADEDQFEENDEDNDSLVHSMFNKKKDEIEGGDYEIEEGTEFNELKMDHFSFSKNETQKENKGIELDEEEEVTTVTYVSKKTVSKQEENADDEEMDEDEEEDEEEEAGISLPVTYVMPKTPVKVDEDEEEEYEEEEAYEEEIDEEEEEEETE